MGNDSPETKPTHYLDFYVGKTVNLVLKADCAISGDGLGLVLAGVVLPHPSGAPGAYALVSPGGMSPNGQMPPSMSAFTADVVAFVQAPIEEEALKTLIPGMDTPPEGSIIA